MVLIIIGWQSGWRSGRQWGWRRMARGELLAVAACCFVHGRRIQRTLVASGRAMILNVYTEPEFRRLGIARQIMGTILDWIRGRGLRSAHLHASDEGRSLYEAGI